MDALSSRDLFNDMICMQSERVTPYLKELQQLNLLSSTKSATADKFKVGGCLASYLTFRPFLMLDL